MDSTSKPSLGRSRKALKGRTLTAGSTEKKKSLDSSPLIQVIDLHKPQDGKKGKQTRGRCSSIEPNAQPDWLTNSKSMLSKLLFSCNNMDN